MSTTNRHGAAGSLVFNLHTYDPSHFDDETRRLLRATIDWFVNQGKERLLRDYRDCRWYATFLEFVAKERVFADMGTPARDKPWDTSRISAFSEILAFYGLDYWYAWQVTILGLGPIWQSENASARSRAAQRLDNGEVFAFGLSEREHGADIYTTDMVLSPDGEGGFRATGGKYYIAEFGGQAEGFTTLMLTAAPDSDQQLDLDVRLALGSCSRWWCTRSWSGPRAGSAYRARSRRARHDLRGLCPGLLGTRGRAARQGVHRCPTAVGTGPRAQARYRHWQVRAGMGAGRGALRRVPDEPMTVAIGREQSPWR